LKNAPYAWVRPNEPLEKAGFWLFSDSLVFDFIDIKFTKIDFFTGSTSSLTGWLCSAAEKPVRVEAVVSPAIYNV